MKIGEKFLSIRDRMGLSEKQMSEILGISVKEYRQLEDGDVNVYEKIVGAFTKTFSITDEEMRDETDSLDDIQMCLEIPVSKYKNIFEAYVGTLVKYYCDSWDVYVLAKVKVKKGIKGFFSTLFRSDKASIMNEMKSFSPTYLVKKKNIRLLVSIIDKSFTVSELRDIENEERFVYEGYRYVRANRVRLKGGKVSS